MGSEYAHLDVDTSVKGVLDILDKDAAEINGKFLTPLVPGMENPAFHQYDGSEIPW